MIKFTILLSCVAAASVATKSCNIFLNDEPVPLSRSSSGDPIREDTESYVTFLTDFSRFMNNKAPALLQVTKTSYLALDCFSLKDLLCFLGIRRVQGHFSGQ